MENSIANSGLNALATAAAEVETSQQAAESETPTAVPGSRAPQTLGATELRYTLQSLSDSVATQLASMSRHVATLSQRMDRVEHDSRPTPVRERVGTSRQDYAPPRLWCDRPLNEPLPTDPPRWDDEDGSEEESSDVGRADAADFTDPAEADDADRCPLQRVSASTEKFLQEAFAKPVPNATRRRWRRTYGMPATDVTKCPKLDTTLRPQVPKDGKDGDRSLSRLQTLLLDAVGPLSAMLESHQAGRLAPETAAEAAAQALRFLGNAHANLSAERRKRIVGHFNKDLKPLVEEPERFASAAPYLFGKDFEKSAKEHVESVRSMRKLSAPGGAGRPQFFRSGLPHQAARGGGGYHGSGTRGRARGRFRPYAAKENRRPRNGEGSNQNRS